MSQCCKGRAKKMNWNKKVEDETSIDVYDYDDTEVNSEQSIIDKYSTNAFTENNNNNINDVNGIVDLLNRLRKNRVEESLISIELKKINGVTRVSFGGNPARINALTYQGKIINLV